MDLSGGTALVTGSNRGIGRAILAALAKEPLDLLLAGMRSPEAHQPLGPTDHVTGGLDCRRLLSRE